MKHIVATNLRMILVSGLIGLALGILILVVSGNAEYVPMLVLMALFLDAITLGVMIAIDCGIVAWLVKEVQEAEKKQYGEAASSLYGFERMAFLIHVLLLQPYAIRENKDELMFYLYEVLSDEDFERFNHI